MSTALSGINANVFIGATDVDASGWSADFEVDTFDSSTTADAGWADTTASQRKISGSFDFFYNPAKKPNSMMKEGDTVALVLWVDEPGGDKFSGNALITKLSYKPKTKEGFGVTASFVNRGPWIMPS